MQSVGLIETLRRVCNRPGPFIVVVPLSTIRLGLGLGLYRCGLELVLYWLGLGLGLRCVIDLVPSWWWCPCLLLG
jgi:hypothetical protein